MSMLRVESRLQIAGVGGCTACECWRRTQREQDCLWHMTTTSGATARVGPRSQLRPCESTQGVTCTSAPEGRPHPTEHLRRHHNASGSNSEDKLSSIPAGCGPGRAGRFMADLAA